MFSYLPNVTDKIGNVFFVWAFSDDTFKRDSSSLFMNIIQKLLTAAISTFSFSYLFFCSTICSERMIDGYDDNWWWMIMTSRWWSMVGNLKTVGREQFYFLCHQMAANFLVAFSQLFIFNNYILIERRSRRRRSLKNEFKMERRFCFKLAVSSWEIEDQLRQL